MATSVCPPGRPHPQGGLEYPGPMQALQPIYNPPVPFTTPVPGGMAPGKMMLVSGVVHPNAKRFTVNLLAGSKNDVAFHIDARIQLPGGNTEVLVRNSQKDGEWGPEERQIPHFPFKPNSNFDILIMAEQGQFKMAVNNEHLLEYRHRLKPLDNIHTLQVLGDISLTQVRFQ